MVEQHKLSYMERKKTKMMYRPNGSSGYDLSTKIDEDESCSSDNSDSNNSVANSDDESILNA
jgi:hypothetical protein